MTDDNFVSLNEYERSQLPDLVEQQQIDVFFLTSIWPETFSFTCSEIISMDVPLICFDMGAPVERTKQYDKGLVPPPRTASTRRRRRFLPPPSSSHVK